MTTGSLSSTTASLFHIWNNNFPLGPTPHSLSTLRTSGCPNSPAYLFGRARKFPSLVVSTSCPAFHRTHALYPRNPISCHPFRFSLPPCARVVVPSVPLSFRTKKGLQARPGINVMQFNVYVNQTRGYHRGDYPTVLRVVCMRACWRVDAHVWDDENWQILKTTSSRHGKSYVVWPNFQIFVSNCLNI